MEECDEPNCTRPAAKTWKGRNVCRDHYDFYKQQDETIMGGMD